MSKYVLELMNHKINIPYTGFEHDASHLYWAVKNTETGKYEPGYVFHGGAIGEGRIDGVGFPTQQVGISPLFGTPEVGDSYKKMLDKPEGKGTPVLAFDTLEEIENVKNIFQATGDEINALGENYGIVFDNSNSVAYLLGRSLGLSDAQLQDFAGKLDTGLVGAPGFGDDLLNGADGDYADMSVEEFLQKTKESGIITDEQIQAITEKVEELPEPPEPIEHTQTAELAGAGASAAFMTYARMAGWTEESWLDEAWEQSVASLAISEAAKDIADWNFQGQDYNFFDWNAAGGSLVASLAANAVGDELGLGGTDAASVVGTSMAISGMSYSINAFTTSAEFSVFATQANPGLLASMANAGAGALGSWAASQVLNSNTEAEAIGAAAGGAIGAAVGSAFFPPLGSAVGAYLGSVLGDTLGETWNEVGELFDDGFQLEDIGAAAWELLVETPGDFVMAAFGGDEKPPPPVAQVVYQFNADTGAYELTHSHAQDGGKVSHVQGAGDQITSVVDQLLAQYTQGEAQLANRHEMPEIRVGYEGDKQYIMVNGVPLGGLNGATIQAAMGEVLGSAVIEGGDPLTNHMFYHDGLSGSERLSVLTDSTIQTTIQYHNNTELQEGIDTRLAERGATLDLMDSRDAKQADVEVAQTTVNSIQTQLSRLSLPMGGENAAPSQSEIDAYHGRKAQLTDQLSTAKANLQLAQAELTEINGQLQSHFEQQHTDEKTKLEQQIDKIAGETPLDSLLESYGDLLEQQKTLDEQHTFSGQQKSLEADFTRLFTDYKAVLAAPIEEELEQLQAELASHQGATPQLQDYSDEQVAAFNQLKTQMLEGKIEALQAQITALDEIELSDIEQMLSQKHEATTALEERIAEIDGYISQSPIPEPASLGFDQQLRSHLVALEAGEEVGGLDLTGIEALGEAHPLDSATRLDYEIRHHNRTHDEAESFDLYETDLSDLVFIQEGDTLTIYNRRLDDVDTPLEELPQLVLADFGQWSDDGLRLRFTNSDGEEVKTDFSLGALMRQFDGDGDGSVDMAQTLADLYTEHTGEPMSAAEAKELRFGHFGQLDEEGNLVGSDGDDLLAAIEGEVHAGGGNDTIVQSGSATHTDGGSGFDTVSYAASEEGVEVDLSSGTGRGGDAEGDSYSDVEGVIGSSHDDILVGDAGDNALSGGKGDDTLIGGAGADILAGGEGVDTADYFDSNAGVRVHLSSEVDGREVAGFGSGGDAQGDRLTGIENVVGSAHDDTVYGNDGDNVMSGKAGDDHLYGGVGDDTLLGGEGSDQLFGGEGNDYLDGGAGDDLLMSGSGDDVIVTGHGHDVVMSGAGDDVIDARSSPIEGDGSKIHKHIDGGSGHDSVTLDGSLEDYEMYQWGDGYRLISDTHDMNLVDVEAVYFANNLRAEPLELEHLYHLKKEQEAREEAEEEALDSRQRTSGVQVVGGVSAAALIALAGQAAAAQAVNPDLAKTDDDKLTEEQWLASLLQETQHDSSDAVNHPPPQDTSVDVAVAAIMPSTDESDLNNQKISIPISPLLDASPDNVNTENSINPFQDNAEVIATEASSDANQEAKENAADKNEPIVESQDALATTVEEDDGNDVDFSEVETTRTSVAPLLKVGDREVNEDGSVALNIQVVGQNTNETLTVYVSGVPEDARLDKGFLRTDGRWQLDQSELAEMRLYPGSDNDQDFVLDILVVSYDIDTQQTTSTQEQFSVTVHAVADTPNLSVSDASGDEDTAIALNIQTSLNDTDGSETQQVIISGVPATAVLSNGEKQADGTWKLTPAQLPDLTITPPVNSGDDFTLTITSYASEGENESVATTTETIDVTVNAVADTPNLSVVDAVGLEDTAIALNIQTSLNDTDASESQYLIISGVPETAVLSNGEKQADGTWRLTPAQLSDLTITPPANSGDDFTLTITSYASESENESVATTTETIDVTVYGVADAPELIVNPAQGNEDEAIGLSIAPTLTDEDGSESLLIIVKGVPDLASLNQGVRQSNGDYHLLQADLDALALTPAPNSDTDLNLTVIAQSTDADSGDMTSTQFPLSVVVHAVADTPNLSVSDASGDEDTAIALNIQTSLNDTDGSETQQVIISGVPATAVLSNGEKQADGTWKLTPAQLPDLTITPPVNSGDDFTLTITSYASEGENGDVATTTETIDVVVNAVADTPNLSVRDASGDEDTAIALNIQTSLNDTDGSETQQVIISGVPATAVLSNGEKQADGTWKLLPSELAGLTITPPENSGDDFRLTVTSYASEGENNSVATTTETIDVVVNAVADTPNLSVRDASGDENTAIALNIQTSLNDTDGSETQQVIISGVPATAVLSNGEKQADGTWKLLPSELAGLTITPPENSGDDFTLTITSYASEGENDSVATTTETIDVTVNAVADTPSLTVSDASGDEDTAIALNIQTGLNDTDGSESVTIVIGNIPAGAMLNKGTALADGKWGLTLADLEGLTITPPADSSEDFILSVTSYAREAENGHTASTTQSINVQVNAVLDDLAMTFEQSSNPVQSITYKTAAGELLGTGQAENINGDSTDNIIKSDYLWQVPINLSAAVAAGETIDWDSIKVKSNVGNPILHFVDGDYVLLFSKEALQSVQGQNIEVSIDIPHSTTDSDSGRVLSTTTSESITIAVPSHFDSLGDTIYAGGGHDRVDGSASADAIDGEAGNDHLWGHEGNDQLDGGAGNDTLIGGAGNDTITGGSGADTLDGGSGNDVLYADLADLSKTVDGGTGADAIHLNHSGTVSLDNVRDVESVYLASGNDRLNLSESALLQNANMTVDGGAGRDTLHYSGDGAGLIDQRFHHFEQIVVNLDDNGNVLTMRDTAFWEGASITGGSGQDVIHIAEAGTYDLRGVDWSTMDSITANANKDVAVKIDESVNLAEFTGNGSSHHVDTIIGVGARAALHIDMTIEDFANSLNSGSNALDKNDHGNDTLTYNGQIFELENIDMLTFKNNEQVYLDSRNNAPIIFKNGSIGGTYYEDGIKEQHQDSRDSRSIDITQPLLGRSYDIENDHMFITDISGSTIAKSSGGHFYSTLNHTGNTYFNFTVSDGEDQDSSSGNLYLTAVNDTPYLYVTTEQFENSNYPDSRFQHQTRYTLNLFDPDHFTWNSTKIESENSEYLSTETFNNGTLLHWLTYSGDLDGDDFARSSGSSFTSQVIDSAGAASNTVTGLVQFDFWGSSGSWLNEDGDERGWSFAHRYSNQYSDPRAPFSQTFSATPILLDLNNDDFVFTQEQVFDFDSDGKQEIGSWVGSSDAVLAIDYDGDGRVTHGHEIAFADWHPEAATDLEGLQLAFDTNQDGVLNELDERWHEFGIWQDVNQNGINDEGEFKTLKEAGISAFHLQSDGATQSGEGYHIFGQGQFEYADGSTGTFADTALAYTEITTDEDEHSLHINNEDAVAMTTAEQEESSNYDDQAIFADEDEAIFAQMLHIEQWQQQSVGAALSESEPAIIEQHNEVEEFAEFL